MLIYRPFQDGNVEFRIVKDTTPNMTNPRLYRTTKDKTPDEATLAATPSVFFEMGYV